MSFSLKHLLFVMLVAALGLAALSNPELPLIADFVKLFTMMTIIILGYGIWSNAGEGRAFRIGFVCWAGFYFLAFVWFQLPIDFGTGGLLDFMSGLNRPQRSRFPSGEAYSTAFGRWITGFYPIGRCMFALLFGFIGGWVTVHFYRKRQQMLSQRS